MEKINTIQVTCMACRTLHNIPVTTDTLVKVRCQCGNQVSYRFPRRPVIEID